MSKASSSAMTSSTRSRLSASRSSAKRASGTTCAASTESTSTAHFLKVSNAWALSIGIAVSLWLFDSVAHAEAAVDRQYCSGDRRGLGGGQERDGGGDFLDSREPSEWHARRQLVATRLGHRFGHVGRDRAGCDDVGGDVAARQLARDRPG